MTANIAFVRHHNILGGGGQLEFYYSNNRSVKVQTGLLLISLIHITQTLPLIPILFLSVEVVSTKENLLL